MLAQLRVQIFDLLRDSAHLPEPLNKMISDRVIGLLRETCGGQEVYIRKQDTVRQELYRAVRIDFDGTNGKEVRAKHKISRATFYRIIGTRPPKA